MNQRIRSLVAAAALATLSAATWAQGASAPAGANTPRIDQRQANQEKRIDQGIASGSLTQREAHRLERQQGVINRAEDKAKADGSVTRQERRKLHHMQDKSSHRIHRQKHDAQRRAASAPGQ